jgi:hypothetical protein
MVCDGTPIGKKFPIGNQGGQVILPVFDGLFQRLPEAGPAGSGQGQPLLGWGPSFRQRSEQYFTSSQTFAHFLRQSKGRPQLAQTLRGRSPFFTIFAMVYRSRLS